MIPYLFKHAGHKLTTGAQAETCANHFIGVHLQQIGGGKTYSELSAAAIALPKGSAAYTATEAKVQTVFMGTTLRSMLLNACGWWQVGQIALIALIAPIASFGRAFVTLLLSGAGLWHPAGSLHTRRYPTSLRPRSCQSRAVRRWLAAPHKHHRIRSCAPEPRYGKSSPSRGTGAFEGPAGLECEAVK